MKDFVKREWFVRRKENPRRIETLQGILSISSQFRKPQEQSRGLFSSSTSHSSVLRENYATAPFFCQGYNRWSFHKFLRMLREMDVAASLKMQLSASPVASLTSIIQNSENSIQKT